MADWTKTEDDRWMTIAGRVVLHVCRQRGRDTKFIGHFGALRLPRPFYSLDDAKRAVENLARVTFREGLEAVG